MKNLIHHLTIIIGFIALNLLAIIGATTTTNDNKNYFSPINDENIFDSLNGLTNNFELNKNNYQEAIDNELFDLIGSVKSEFGSTVKRGFTNYTIQLNLRREVNTKTIDFDDLYFRESDNEVTLTNLKIPHMIQSRMIAMETDLIYNVMNVTIDLGNITIIANYEISNVAQQRLLPIDNHGKIIIQLVDVIAVGRIGFQPVNDAFETNNYDLQYKTAPIIVTVEYISGVNGERVISETIKDNMDDPFLAPLKLDLWSRVQEELMDRLNNVLNEVSLTKTFNSDKDITNRYLKHSAAVSNFINIFMKNFIIELRRYIKAQNLEIYRIPEFHKTFKRTALWGLIKYEDEFHAYDGKVENLGTIESARQASFQPVDDDKVEIFGHFKLNYLNVYFSRYLAKVGIIKPSGSVNIATGSNLFYIKLLLNTKKFSVVNIDFKIFELNGIKVQTSGLWGPVDWFLSQVATCLAGHMKSDIIRGVETEIKIALEKYLKNQKSF